VRKKYQKHGPEISGWIGNAKPVYIATRKPKSTKLMKKKKRMWDKIEGIAQIKVSGISLSLRVN
jgi:hypothetical protein